MAQTSLGHRIHRDLYAVTDTHGGRPRSGVWTGRVVGPKHWVWAFGLASSACVANGHPLGGDGNVEVQLVVDGPLFATDLLDDDGLPSGPRQTPNRTDVVLRMTEDTEVAHGAYVRVHVEPPEALTLGQALDLTAEGALDENDAEPTCSLLDGAFQCRANSEGAARFSISSPADWSGEARVVVSFAAITVPTTVEVLPAGLPEAATNFELIGISDGEEIRPTFLALGCTVDALPEDLGDKWPVGRIRAREVFVRATPPAAAPTVVEHAPVVIESLSGEGALSLDESCEQRTTRLRVLLDKQGESPRFFACFSDVGGDVRFGIQSGQKVVDPGPQITVSAEPRLLRVRVLDGKSMLPQSDFLSDVFEVSAFDVRLLALPVDVDLALQGTEQPLVLETNSATTAPQGALPVTLAAVPQLPGTTKLIVTPRLLAEPACESPSVTVLEPKF